MVYVGLSIYIYNSANSSMLRHYGRLYGSKIAARAVARRWVGAAGPLCWHEGNSILNCTFFLKL